MPAFYYPHHIRVAKIIGNLPVLSDQCIQVITEEFGKAFESDNKEFDWKDFQSKITRVREGR